MTALLFIINQQTFRILCFLFLSTILYSCGSNKVPSQSFKFSYCFSEMSYHQDDFVMDTLSTYSPLLQTKLSEHDMLMCKVLGIENKIEKLFILKKDSSQTSKQEILEIKQEIAQKMSLAKTELDAFISELDCEGERADLAAGYLDNINGSNNTKLTVGSVVVGALTTIATVLIKDDNTETAVGVSGGLVSAGLGALTINPKGKRIEFYHPKNILTPVWNNYNNSEYPNLVWNIFIIEEFNSEEGFSLLESTKKRWLKYVLNNEITPKEEILFFGSGGDYTAEDLHKRSEMIDQIKSSTRYINQLLSIFESDLYRLY